MNIKNKLTLLHLKAKYDFLYGIIDVLPTFGVDAYCCLYIFAKFEFSV